jgi:hypothetical protein
VGDEERIDEIGSAFAQAGYRLEFEEPASRPGAVAAAVVLDANGERLGVAALGVGATRREAAEAAFAEHEAILGRREAMKRRDRRGSS